MLFRFLLSFLVVTLSISSSATETLAIDTPRKAKIELLVDLPQSEKPLPVILVAPGQGYHARLPLFERLVDVAKANGIAVVRFDWAYYTADPKSGKPSAKLIHEIEAMESALSWIRRSPKLDGDRLTLAGKSLGSLVAWQVFDRDKRASALVLLTPVCVDTSQEKALNATFENYPGLENLDRPVMLLAGDSDPLCPTQFLYSNASRMKATPRVAVVGGDHGFGDKSAKDPVKTQAANLDLAARSSVDFVVKNLAPR